VYNILLLQTVQFHKLPVHPTQTSLRCKSSFYSPKHRHTDVPSTLFCKSGTLAFLSDIVNGTTLHMCNKAFTDSLLRWTNHRACQRQQCLVVEVHPRIWALVLISLLHKLHLKFTEQNLFAHASLKRLAQVHMLILKSANCIT
jgi:hypothetical protein